MVLYLRIDCVQHKDPTGDITEWTKCGDHFQTGLQLNRPAGEHVSRWTSQASLLSVRFHCRMRLLDP